VVIGWAWTDAAERYRSKGAAFMIVILLLLINIFGLIIYLIIRPKFTRDEEYWNDLEKRFLKYEAQGIGDCPHCGDEVQPSFIHCPNCGKSLRVKCKSCEMYLEPEWKVCPFCGKRQKSEKKEIKTAPVSNIDTLPNRKILKWGKQIDRFFKGIKKSLSNLGQKFVNKFPAEWGRTAKGVVSTGSTQSGTPSAPRSASRRKSKSKRKK
jgi:RNA polymerase subunit RPABC4/transcription elongation factor Spt4